MTNKTKEMTYYDLLDVPSEATDDEIKKAYYRKIRIYTNEDHPKEFMALRNAYEVLSDSVKRRDYDISLHSHPNSLAHMKEIERYMDNEQFEDALELIKMEMQTGYYTENLLANRITCEMRLQNYWEAINQMNSLTMDNKTDKTFYYFYQTVAYRELGLYDKAQHSAKQLVLISPEVANHHIVYASIFYSQNRFTDVKSIYNNLINNQELTREFIPLLLDYVMLQQHIDLSDYEKKRLRYAIMSIPKDDSSRSIILQQIIEYIPSLDWVHFDSAKEICDIAEQMNTNNDAYIRDEISRIRQWIRDGENEVRQEQQSRSSYEPPSTRSEQYSTNPHSQRPEQHYAKPPRGNILIAIIVGVLLSAALTPLGGIIGGAIYYRFAKQIWNFVGCLIMIVIAIAIIALFFG